MNRGFYLIDGLLASCIILISIQGTMLLSRTTKQMEAISREKEVAWTILGGLNTCPIDVIDGLSELEYSFQGDPVQGGGRFHVQVTRSHADGFGCIDFTLRYEDFFGETIEIKSKRWVVVYE